VAVAGWQWGGEELCNGPKMGENGQVLALWQKKTLKNVIFICKKNTDKKKLKIYENNQKKNVYI
jgi:hypothetical protein